MFKHTVQQFLHSDLSRVLTLNVDGVSITIQKNHRVPFSKVINLDGPYNSLDIKIISYDGIKMIKLILTYLLKLDYTYIVVVDEVSDEIDYYLVIVKKCKIFNIPFDGKYYYIYKENIQN